jgi:hypothetical protein
MNLTTIAVALAKDVFQWQLLIAVIRSWSGVGSRVRGIFGRRARLHVRREAP